MKRMILLLVVVNCIGCVGRKNIIQPPAEFTFTVTPAELAEMVAVHDSGIVEEVKKIREDVIRTRSQIKSMVEDCICPTEMK